MALVEGFEGSQLHVRERPIPGTRQKQEHAVRCVNGSFEKEYGVGKHDGLREALYQAGVAFGQIVERAGMDGPGTVDWSKVGTTQWRGQSDSRLVALQSWKKLTQELGKLVTARLILYVVEGKTSAQIAKKYRRSKREIAAQLSSDLALAAIYFGYAPRR